MIYYVSKYFVQYMSVVIINDFCRTMQSLSQINQNAPPVLIWAPKEIQYLIMVSEGVRLIIHWDPGFPKPQILFFHYIVRHALDVEQ